MNIYSESEESTLELGRRLARLLQPGQVVALYGDLGAGKTVLSRGVAQGLGVTEPVTSPTFTVVQEYHLADGRFFFHLDMYRIDSAESAVAFGIEDFLFANDAITLVEWPERIEPLLERKGCIRMTLTHVEHDRRLIEIPDDLGTSLR